MAEPIKIQVVLDDKGVAGQVDKIKKGLEGAVDSATEAGKKAGKGYGEGFNNGSSSAINAGLDAAKKKTKDLSEGAAEAGHEFGSALGGAISSAFEGNFNEVIKKLGELKAAAIEIGESIGKGVFKDMAAELEAAGVSAEAAAAAFKSAAIGIGLLVGVVAAVGAALLGLGVKTAEFINHLDEMSKATDIDIQTLGALKGAFDENGGSIDSLTNSLEHLNVFYGQAQEGSKKNLDTLLKYGITSTDTARRVDQMMKAIAGIQDPAERARVATELVGKANAIILLQMPELEKGLDGVREKYKALSDVLNPEAVEAARKFKEVSEELRQTAEITGHKIGNETLPFVTRELNKFNVVLDSTLGTLSAIKAGDFGQVFKDLLPEDFRKDLERLGVLSPKAKPAAAAPPKRDAGVGEFGPLVTPEQVNEAQDRQDAADRARLQGIRDGLDKEKKVRTESAKAIIAAQAALADAASQDRQRQEQDAAERLLKTAEEEFKLGILGYKDYYAARLALSRGAIQAEIDAIDRSIDARNQELEALKQQKNTEAAQAGVMAVLTKLWGDREIAVRNYADAETDAFKAAGFHNAALIEQIPLLEDKFSIENKIIRQAKESNAAREADPLFQESERLRLQIKNLNRFISQPDANFAARQQAAALEAIAEVADADKKATLSMIKDRVLLADATIYHSTRAQAILLDHLAAQKSVTQSVGDAMIAVYEGVAGAIDKGIGKLTARLGIFGDAVREVLSGITRSVLTLFTTTLMGGRGGGGGAGGGGIIGALTGGGGAGGFGGVLNAFQASGAPASGAATGFGALGGLLAAGNAPAFAGGIAQFTGGFGGGLANFPVAAGGLGLSSGITAPAALSTAATLGAGLTGIAKGFFGPGAIAKGLPGSTGFANFIAGIGGAGGLALGALGVSLGAGIGGTSKTGSVLGGIGGGILGIGAGIAGTAFGLGATLAVALAPLLGAALIAAPFIIAAILLNRASARKKDEALADSYWKGAADQIVELTRQVNSDKIDGQDALTEAIALRSQAVQQISTIKTASVRESRLAHQIPDLDRVYIEPLKRAVEAQARRRATGQSIIPEFATGGYVGGIDRGYDSVLARLRPGEAVLTREQQARLGGEGAMRLAGVPGFAEGGVVSATSVNSAMIIYLEVNLGVSPQAAGDLVVTGATTPQGRQVVVRTVKTAQKNREL
jgi:hypothetical protein